MGLSFQPKTEAQLAEANLIPDKSECDFEVLQAWDKVSKAGSPMIHVKLNVYREDGTGKFIDDYLLGAMEAKLRHFCDTTGLLPQYQAGSLCAADCVGRAGKVRVGIEKDETGQYPPKNKIKDYVVRKAKPLTSAPPPKPETDDDVPF